MLGKESLKTPVIDWILLDSSVTLVRPGVIDKAILSNLSTLRKETPP